VALALVAWFVSVGQEAPDDQPAGNWVPDYPTVPHWSEPVGLDGLPAVIHPGYLTILDTAQDHIVLVYNMDHSAAGSDRVIVAIDLDQRQTLWQGVWSAQSDQTPWLAGDLVLLPQGELGRYEIVEVSSGEVLDSFTLASAESLRSASGQMILTHDADTDTLCARLASAAQTCQWQVSTRDDCWWVGSTFGPEDQWVNTCAGVVKLASGEPAGFGFDEGLTFTDTGTLESVYYVDHDAIPVLRVAVRSEPDGLVSIQARWDPAADQPVSAAITGQFITTDRAASVALVQVDQPEPGVEARWWATGELAWQLPGRGCSTGAADTDSVFVFCDTGTDPRLRLLDDRSGAVQWQSESSEYAWWLGAGQNMVYLVSQDLSQGGDLQVVGLDKAHQFAERWRLPSPAKLPEFRASNHHVYVIDPESGQFWVMTD
jgi:hypothetical protein